MMWDKLCSEMYEVGEFFESLTDVVKFLFWIGVTILVYSLVGHVLFPTEFILIPRPVWG